MASKESSAKREETEKPIPTSSRMTRSSTRKAAGEKSVELMAEFSQPEVPKRKKAKVSSTEEESKKTKKAKAGETVEKKEASKNVDNKTEKRTIVIEHCKQCNSFKTRAIQVKNGLENGVPGIEVLVNPDKPRRGCFEIREDGGEMFVSLLDMKRPFTPMKKLDMDKVISDIIDKLSESSSTGHVCDA